MILPDRAEVTVKIILPFPEDSEEFMPAAAEEYGTIEDAVNEMVMGTLLEEFRNEIREQGIEFERQSTRLLWD